MGASIARRGRPRERTCLKTAEDIERLAKTLGGIPIWGALPKSAAEKSGLRYGDILLKVNGQAIPSIDAYLSVRLRSEGRTLDLTIFRDGEEVTLSLRMPGSKSPSPDVASAVRQVVEGRLLPSKSGKPPPPES